MSAKDNAGHNGQNAQDGQPRHDVQAELEDELEDDDEFDPAEYNTLIQLERLESLEEEMEELEVTTLDGLRARIRDLHAEMGE